MRRLVLCCMHVVWAVVLLLVFMPALPAQAQVYGNFSAPAFSRAMRGDIAIASNTLMTCPASDSRCAAVQAGNTTSLNNNDFDMIWIDTDTDASTFDSSQATLTIPSGGTIRAAYLFWTGILYSGTASSMLPPNPAAKDRVLFAPPGQSYRSIT